VTAHATPAQGPKTNNSAAPPRAAAPGATPAAAARRVAVASSDVAASGARAAPAALASRNVAAVVKRLGGEDLRVLEGWAAPLALLDGDGPRLLGARVSPAGRVELAAPSASFLSRLRVGLSAAGRLLLDVGGPDAWLANQQAMGGSPLFALGLGEAFSTVARVEHRLRGAPSPRAAATAASAAALGRTIAGDYSADGRVLVVWIDPARLRERAQEAGGATAVPAPARFELALGGGAGGGPPVALEHGTVFVAAAAGPTRGDGGGGGTGPSFAVRARASDPPSPFRPAPGTLPALVELRFYISAAVARRCALAGDAGARREAADSVLAL